MLRQFDCSSVLSWLDTLPTSPESVASLDHDSELRKGKCRRYDPLEMETSATRTPSPSKKRRIDANSVRDGNTRDTPRGIPIRHTPSFATPSIEASSERSFSSRRSRSPEKKINAMRSAPQPIELQQFHGRKEEIPDELKTILKTIDGRFSRGIRVISNEYKVNQSLRPAGPLRLTVWPKDEISAITASAFEAINEYDFVYTNPDDLPGPSPTPQQCAKAMWLAARCETMGCSEAAWNSSVHNYILDIALYTTPFIDRVYFINWYVLWSFWKIYHKLLNFRVVHPLGSPLPP
jgi:hypothetical protein